MATRKPRFGGYLDFIPTQSDRTLIEKKIEEITSIELLLSVLLVAGLKITVREDNEHHVFVLNLTPTTIPSKEKLWVVSIRASTVSKVIATAWFYWVEYCDEQYWGDPNTLSDGDYW